MTSVLLAIIGTWIISDGVYSITLYLNSQSYDGRKQTWKQDHWVRLLRIALGVAVIILGSVA